ncbi:transposase [Candidatus Poribacteria bacterium]|nr:transposase [Candidatus Poribacteria bacterium]
MSIKVTAKVDEHTDTGTPVPFIESVMKQGATVYTDDASVHNSLTYNVNEFNLESVKHSVGEYVNKQAHTNGVESFWSTLKHT